MVTYYWMDPPDYGVCWGVYLVHNAREAIQTAVADPEFHDWVADARGDDIPPFKGLRAKLWRCSHGVCYDEWTEEKERFPCQVCEEEGRLHDTDPDYMGVGS